MAIENNHISALLNVKFVDKPFTEDPHAALRQKVYEASVMVSGLGIDTEQWKILDDLFFEVYLALDGSFDDLPESLVQSFLKYHKGEE